MSKAQSFLDFVRRSQLVEEDQLDKFLAEYLKTNDGKLPERQEALSEAMIEAELITDWQADKLLAGKHKGFILGKYKLLRHLGKGRNEPGLLGRAHSYARETRHQDSAGQSRRRLYLPRTVSY